MDDLDFDAITGAAYNNDGMMFFREPFTAINAAVSANAEQAAETKTATAVEAARIPMSTVRDKYRALQPASSMILQQESATGSGCGSEQRRGVYSFNPARSARPSVGRR